VVAGPLFNLLLAIVIYMVVAWIGLPFFSPVIGSVLIDSPADKAGMKAGDRIISIQGKPVESWDDIPALMQDATAKTRYEIIIERDATQFTVHVSPIMTKGTNIFGEEIDRGMIGISRDIGAVIAGVGKGSPAEKAGLKPGDRIISLANKPVETLDQLTQTLKDAKPGDYTALVVERGSRHIAVSLPPSKGKRVDVVAHREITMPSAGIAFVMPRIERRSLGFTGGIGFGFTKSWQIIELTGMGVWKMLNGTIDAKKSLGGPYSSPRCPARPSSPA
jgi:regulator of sigma E protease